MRLRAKRRVIPSAAIRRARSPRSPRGVELLFLLIMGKRANAFAAVCRKVLTPSRIASFAAPDTAIHTDAPPPPKDDDPAHARLIHDLRHEVKKHRELQSDKFLIDANTVAERVVKHSQSEFDRLGIKLSESEPDLTDMVDEWRHALVQRITSVEDDQLDKIEDLLADGDGYSVKTLQDEIERQIDGVSTSRAELIARDQTLKLNAMVTKERHAAAGIESYIWTTSDDERVRPSHEALEGQEFRWDDPPEINDDGDTGGPGEDYQCRCIPFPVLPELADDAPEEDAEADDEE